MCKVTKTPAMHVLRGTPERSQHVSGLGFRIWGLGFRVCEKDTSNLLNRAHFTCKEYLWVLLLDKTLHLLSASSDRSFWAQTFEP